MAPYAIAHFKLSLQLAGRDLPEEQRKRWAYHPEESDRLGIYLTNSLEEAHEMTGLPLFTQWVADETRAANEVKRHLPVLVVMGNPPYSGHSANEGNWIENLLKGKLPYGRKTGNYYEVDGKPLGERNTKWLQDDYVKFIRFGQWRIENSGQGILAFISNNGYLDNPTFRGMRQSLMQTFTEIYLLNLHGSAKKREIAPDGGKDENVFDIQQGVTIGIFIKQSGKQGLAKVYNDDLWGIRNEKYKQLFEDNIQTTRWEEIYPQSPFYLFVPQNIELLNEYEQGWKITDVVPEYSIGCLTKHDKLVIGFSIQEVHNRIENFIDPDKSDLDATQEFGLKLRDKDKWDASIARTSIITHEVNDYIRSESFRPFDSRFIFYHKRFVARLNRRIMGHLDKSNLALITVRQLASLPFDHIWLTDSLVDQHIISVRTKEGGVVFPLYLYYQESSTVKQKNLFESSSWNPDEAHGGRIPNISFKFVQEMEHKLGLTFTLQGMGIPISIFCPEDIFNYIYAILHSPSYRNRYAEFLKRDFPRIPTTSNVDLFRELCQLGSQLVALHLLESPEVSQFITRYPVPGEDHVEKGYPKYVPPENGQGGRVQINKDQFFEGVPEEVWEFHIGGYQVLHKWLKDRRGRQLSYDDLTHYQKIVISLSQTIRLMAQIDQTIDTHGGWPIA
jgi:predicted helicase